MWYFKIANGCATVDLQDSSEATWEGSVSNPTWGTFTQLSAENGPEEHGL